MHRLLGGMLIMLLAGCGSAQDAVQVTPVMASTKGTYRLVASLTSVTASDGITSSFAYNSGTLRLDDLTYTQTLNQQGSNGVYSIGSSVNTILNSRQGTFFLTSTDPPYEFSGSYQVTPDFTLTLNFNQFDLTGQGLVTRSETWFKESDSPYH